MAVPTTDIAPEVAACAVLAGADVAPATELPPPATVVLDPAVLLDPAATVLMEPAAVDELAAPVELSVVEEDELSGEEEGTAPENPPTGPPGGV